MKNAPKTRRLIGAIFALLLLSIVLSVATVGFASVWAKFEAPPMRMDDAFASPALAPEAPVPAPAKPTPTIPTSSVPVPIRDECAALYYGLPITRPTIHYNGRAIMRCHDSRENVIWFSIENEEIYQEICMDMEDEKIPESYLLYTDRVDMYLNVTSGDEVVLNDWYLVEKTSGIKLGKPSDKQLRARYEIENKHYMVQKGLLPETIYLSELKPNVIYSYTPELDKIQGYPNIINDLGESCILYTKHHGFDLTYGAYACPDKMLANTSGATFGCAFYEEGHEYRLMYTKADSEALHNLAIDDSINITDLIEWCNTGYFYMYVYNNTDKEYQLTATPEWEENPVSDVAVLKPGDFVGCWSPAHIVEVQEIPEKN